MLLAMMILMMASYTSAFLEIVDIRPSENINLGNTTGITIICRYDLRYFIHFYLVRNGDDVIFQMNYSSREKKSKVVIKRKGFHCTPIHSRRGQVTCWKLHLTCEDAAYYTCRSNEEVSQSRRIKVRPYVSRLQVLNPPIEVGKTLILRCTAYVGEDFGIATFVWFEITRLGVSLLMRPVHVPPRGKCYKSVVSSYRYTLKRWDADTANITCFLNGKTLTKQLIPTGWKQREIGQNNADKLCGANTITKFFIFATYLVFIGICR
ncbi:uncharacterized protein LOC106880709 [Octopus bimaculoides]|uniref:uncharacterized protein LOC106880709 n=1 Tax=Octopus bimaculoides TaxID=37653 RepID=UPI00071D93A9|nr:uncharacterized protein LOC106880709 [Octopus bimaculoides]|eukprot:XP_014786271.1 PREDICTED: uncharacterized protein LOC106880709 [Octopus bimaculoides]